MSQTTTLLQNIFGPDNLMFKTINKSVVVHEYSLPNLKYDHNTWESSYEASQELKVLIKSQELTVHPAGC